MTERQFHSRQFLSSCQEKERIWHNIIYWERGISRKVCDRTAVWFKITHQLLSRKREILAQHNLLKEVYFLRKVYDRTTVGFQIVTRLLSRKRENLAQHNLLGDGYFKESLWQNDSLIPNSCSAIVKKKGDFGTT